MYLCECTSMWMDCMHVCECVACTGVLYVYMWMCGMYFMWMYCMYLCECTLCVCCTELHHVHGWAEVVCACVRHESCLSISGLATFQREFNRHLSHCYSNNDAKIIAQSWFVFLSYHLLTTVMLYYCPLRYRTSCCDMPGGSGSGSDLSGSDLPRLS